MKFKSIWILDFTQEYKQCASVFIGALPELNNDTAVLTDVQTVFNRAQPELNNDTAVMTDVQSVFNRAHLFLMVRSLN